MSRFNPSVVFALSIGFLSGVLVCLFSLLASSQTYVDGYEKGQIDAINGKIEYHLVVNPDKTSQWEKISKK